MGRGGARIRLLIAPAAALAVAGAAGPEIPIREARWLSTERLLDALAFEPRECLAWPQGRAARRSAAIGRAAFRAPLLLGGQAARAGLSCASCHRNGRGNPDFLFPGLSGAPGTADVTSSLISSHRGDDSPNPKPIPDLAAPEQKISRSPVDPALETFIRGLIVEEFDGPEPAPPVLRGLADYVRAIRPEGCRGGVAPVSLRRRLNEIEEAVALSRGTDPETSRLLLAAARSTLGSVDERYRLPGLEAHRAAIARADRALHGLRSGTGSQSEWRRSWRPVRRLLLRDERRSFFSAKVLANSVTAPAH